MGAISEMLRKISFVNANFFPKMAANVTAMAKTLSS